MLDDGDGDERDVQGKAAEAVKFQMPKSGLSVGLSVAAQRQEGDELKKVHSNGNILQTPKPWSSELVTRV